MQYFITFLEGIISFISPCMLPLLPLYVSYFASASDDGKRGTFARALAFVAGFSAVFTLLGVFAGTLGSFFYDYRTAVNIVCGVLTIIFGLSYLEIIRLPFFGGMKKAERITGVVSAFVFGIIYSVSLTPCVGAFLGSALALASASGTALKGALLLLAYSAGIGLPFLISALLIDRLKTAFGVIKKHYKVINTVCALFLILMGVLMAAGLLDRYFAIFS